MNQEIKNYIDQQIAQAQNKAQYSVQKVPFHTHNGIDSPSLVNIDTNPSSFANIISIDSLKISAGQNISFQKTEQGVSINSNYIITGSGTPVLVAPIGTLYINTSGSSTTNRLYINTNGQSTWAYITTSA